MPRPEPTAHARPLPSVTSEAEASSSTVSLRASPLLRSSQVSLPNPWAISFRVKLGQGDQ